jgi:predicted acetyltransferase
MYGMPLTLHDARTSPELATWLKDAYYRYIEELVVFDPDMYSRDPEGNWQPDYLPYWMSHDFCHPLVVTSDATPVAFAFIGVQPFPFMSADRSHRVCEFYVDRAARRTGMGRETVRALLASRPGAWELFVLEKNHTAQRFWQAVLEAQASDVRTSVEEHGTLITFNVAEKLTIAS